MREWKHTNAQNALISKPGEPGIPVVEICRKAGISPATLLNWSGAQQNSRHDFPRNRHGGLMLVNMQRLKDVLKRKMWSVPRQQGGKDLTLSSVKPARVLPTSVVQRLR